VELLVDVEVDAGAAVVVVVSVVGGNVVVVVDVVVVGGNVVVVDVVVEVVDVVGTEGVCRTGGLGGGFSRPGWGPTGLAGWAGGLGSGAGGLGAGVSIGSGTTWPSS
jgi:hypothetical protein